MKAFARRSLAMAMTLFMVLSVCVFPAYADEVTPIAVTDVSLNKSSTKLTVGEYETMTAEITPADATNKAVTWDSSDKNVATVDAEGKVEALKAGETTITVTTADGGKTATCKVTVEMNDSAVITKVEAVSSYGIPYDISEYEAEKLLKSEVELTVTYDQGVVKETHSWEKAADETFDSGKIGNTCKFTPVMRVPEGVELPVITTTVEKAKLASDKDSDIGSMSVLLGVAEKYLELPEYVSLDLNNRESVTFGIGSYDGKKTVNDLFEDWTSTDYNDDKVGTYTFTAKWKGGSDLYELGDLKLTVNVVDSDFTLSNIDFKGVSLSPIADKLDELLKGMYNDTFEYIEFDKVDFEGGDLYIVADDGSIQETDEEGYDSDDFDDLVYIPNGNGEDSYIKYTASTDDKDETVEGKITFESSTFMLVSIELTDKEYATLDASDFEEAFLNMNNDYESLDYVIFSGTNSKTRGHLFTEYDEDDNDGTDVKSSTKCYFDADDIDDDDDVALDDVVYVPGSSMKAGTYYITFKATGEDDEGDAVKNKTGYLRIILTEEADIVVETGKKEEVSLDYSLFEEFFDDNVSKTYKNYVITYITFEGAPKADNKGWLYADGEKVKKPNNAKFWIDTDDSDAYLFDDLTFMGGSSAGTTRANFTIYAKKNASAKDSSSKAIVSGDIDFIVGTSHTMSGTVLGAKVMNFNETVTLNAFEGLGDNDNDYIVFTSLPIGGKLVYNWGKSGQTDVKIGTEYWLSYKSGKNLMSNVTFVPSYSSSKIDKTVSIGVKGYNAKGKVVTGTINIGVDYAVTSAKFTDITTSTYADSVDFLYNQGITTGITATTFGPNNNVTRAQFVTFLWRASGSPSVYGVTNKFTDVKSTGTYAYAYQAILWAVQNNITTGRSATTFDPGANVTHQELLTFLYRYDVNYLKHSSTASSYVNYTDFSSVDSWAQTPVKWADYKGILDGYTIQPKVAGTRATVALWLHRMLTL